MDIKEYDKLTSAGEILLDLFCGLLPLCLREFSVPEKRHMCQPYKDILPLPPFFHLLGHTFSL